MRTRLTLFAGFLMLFGPFGGTAYSQQDYLSKVIQTLSSSSTGTVCQKADAFRGTYSLRSFQGALCKTDYVAAFALLECKGVGDFDNSQCHAYAIRTLEGADPQVVLKTAIVEGEAQARELLCANTQKLSPDTAKIAEELCAIP